MVSCIRCNDRSAATASLLPSLQHRFYQVNVGCGKRRARPRFIRECSCCWALLLLPSYCKRPRNHLPPCVGLFPTPRLPLRSFCMAIDKRPTAVVFVCHFLFPLPSYMHNSCLRKSA